MNEARQGFLLKNLILIFISGTLLRLFLWLPHAYILLFFISISLIVAPKGWKKQTAS